MEKIALDVLGLQPSMSQTNSYSVVLSEQHGNRRLSILIGPFEAQAIAVAIENIHPTRPLTHDLFKSVIDAFHTSVREIVINNLQDGVFFAKLICVHNGVATEIDSRPSDALALALRFNCPIYTFDFILEEAGIVLESNEPRKADARASQRATGNDGANSVSDNNAPLSNMSVEELLSLLPEVLKKEDYQRAAHIRDEINRRKS